jgi:hypothetical protein
MISVYFSNTLLTIFINSFILLPSGFTPLILALRYGDRVVTLVMSRLSFRVHTFVCALFNALTGSYIWLGLKLMSKFLGTLLNNYLVAGCIILALMGFLLGIHIHNINYYNKRFKEVYGEKEKTRKAFLKYISVTTLPFLVASFVSDYITSMLLGI